MNWFRRLICGWRTGHDYQGVDEQDSGKLLTIECKYCHDIHLVSLDTLMFCMSSRRLTEAVATDISKNSPITGLMTVQPFPKNAGETKRILGTARRHRDKKGRFLPGTFKVRTYKGPIIESRETRGPNGRFVGSKKKSK